MCRALFSENKAVAKKITQKLLLSSVWIYFLKFDQLKLSEINNGKFNFLENLSFPSRY